MAVLSGDHSCFGRTCKIKSFCFKDFVISAQALLSEEPMDNLTQLMQLENLLLVNRKCRSKNKKY